MVHDLRARGLRIDAIGMQGHWRVDSPDVEAIEASIVAFAGTGVRVHITELDIEMLPRKSGADLNDNFERTAENNPYVDGLPEEKQEELARRYAGLFSLFLKHRDSIDRVTFWGVTDRDSCVAAEEKK
jgi:endo-1,4-beta-xylanase